MGVPTGLLLVQSAFLALDSLSLAPRNAETSPSRAKHAVALAFSMRHPVYHSAPIVPYLEYHFASNIDRRPDMVNTVGKTLKNTDNLVGYVFLNQLSPGIGTDLIWLLAQG
jgi:hypothetical protein